MSFNKSPLAFEDVKDVLDRALASPKGIRVRMGSESEAKMLAQRAYYHRRKEREIACIVYPVGHPLHPQDDIGVCRWDSLKMVVRDNVVIIRPYSATIGDIEEISEDE